MNNVFSKNISALMQKNSELAQKLLVYIPTEVPQLIHENNTYNFLYKGQFIHNKDNPLGEALEIFSRAENSPVSIHLIYGLGLGYLFQVASERSKGTVILYEPDLNILWFAFTLVDFSNTTRLAVSSTLGLIFAFASLIFQEVSSFVSQ